jgi:hypothetical protein
MMRTTTAGTAEITTSPCTASLMPAFYEVWDLETSNLINSFDTEQAALEFLRRLFDLNGLDGVRDLAIMRQTLDASGEYEPTLVLEGPALLTRVIADSSASNASGRRAAS